MLNLDLWYLLPVGISIGMLAMSSGISGSNFWIPLYMIGIGIEPKVGFWLALLTMIFGFGSGVFKNLCSRTVNWYLVGQYLKVCLPASILGGALSTQAPQQLLLACFGVFVTGYGVYSLVGSLRHATQQLERHNKIYWGVGLMAGFLLGLIATGLGKLILPCYINHQRISKPAEAVGTTVVIVFIVNISALVARLNHDLIRTLSESGASIMSVMLWVAPSVILGGQIGPQIAQHLPQRALRVYVGGLLMVVGGLILIRAFGGTVP
ncbi:hypothetical protein NKDENANG_03362 [Candidatus Entotheonellaceae bacterium PAL068K]